MTEESRLESLESINLVSLPITTVPKINSSIENTIDFVVTTISHTMVNATTIADTVDTTIATTLAETGIVANTTTVKTLEQIQWPVDEIIRDSVYNLAGWQLAFSIMTILFAVVIGTYGPYVFGKQALVNGMSVATDFWEFFLPVKYAGRPVDEKMDSYTPEAYVSKIRRFGGFIAFTMIAFAFLEMVCGAVGRAGLKDHRIGGGSLMLFDAHVTLCILCGITSFCLLCSSVQMFRHRFLPEMMLVYSIRNLFMLCLFTANWMRALGVDKQIEDHAANTMNQLESLHNKTSMRLNNLN